MSQLTPEERARCNVALDAARKELEKVFDSFFICVRFEDLNVKSSVQTDFHGPFPEVVGLAQIALWRFQERERANVESPDDNA